MPAEDFEHQAVVAAGRDRCWDALTDVERLVGWVPILSDAVELAPLERYSAVLTDKLGPFSLRADLTIDITEIEPGRHIGLVAEGRDRQLDSRIYVMGHLELESVGSGTAVHVQGRYEVTGRVATFGAPMIRMKAGKIIGAFFAGLTDALA